MAEMKTVEVYVMVDGCGDYVVHKDRGELADAWDSDIGGVCVGGRVLALALQVDVSDTCLTAVVPADAADARKSTIRIYPRQENPRQENHT